ncbi:MAG: CPBP family intramembrane glutamic endopeptidase [archaeon]
MRVSIALYLALLIITLYSKRGTILKRLGFKEDIDIPKEAIIGIAFLGLLLFTSMAVSLIFYQIGMGQDVQKTTEILRQIPIHQILIILLLGSFVEEIFFRGFIQEKTNLLVASLIFALFHITYGTVSQIVGTFFLGLILGYQYERTGGVYSPIISHTFYNLIVILPVYII